MRSPTSPQMKAQWSVNLSMNTPTTLSVLVPAYNEQYLVYANLGRLSSKSTQKSGSCRSTNSTLDSLFRRKSRPDQGISEYPRPNCTRNRLKSKLATKPTFTYLPLLRIRMPVVISKVASSNAKNVILGITAELHSWREKAKREVVPNLA